MVYKSLSMHTGLCVKKSDESGCRGYMKLEPMLDVICFCFVNIFEKLLKHHFLVNKNKQH